MFHCPHCSIKISGIKPEHYPVTCSCGFVVTAPANSTEADRSLADGSSQISEPILHIPPRKGVGTELTNILKQMGVRVSCSLCNERAAIMDIRGPEWCESHRETILEWLREGAKKNGYPFSKWIANRLLNRAIRQVKV